MMQVLRRLSIRGKLIAMLMMTSATVLIVSAASFVIWDYYRFRSDIVRELSIQAQMVLENTTAAISFSDPQTARETLETLPVWRRETFAGGSVLLELSENPTTRPLIKNYRDASAALGFRRYLQGG